MSEDKDTEIDMDQVADLRAELAHSANAIRWKAEENTALRAELARVAEQTKIVLDYAAENQRFSDEIERMREALERISSCDGLHLGDVLDIAQAALVPRAAARQGSEEISRLRDIIRRALAYHEAEELELIEAWIDDARAALTPRPCTFTGSISGPTTTVDFKSGITTTEEPKP